MKKRLMVCVLTVAAGLTVVLRPVAFADERDGPSTAAATQPAVEPDYTTRQYIESHPLHWPGVLEPLVTVEWPGGVVDGVSFETPLGPVWRRSSWKVGETDTPATQGTRDRSSRYQFVTVMRSKVSLRIAAGDGLFELPSPRLFTEMPGILEALGVDATELNTWTRLKLFERVLNARQEMGPQYDWPTRINASKLVSAGNPDVHQVTYRVVSPGRVAFVAFRTAHGGGGTPPSTHAFIHLFDRKTGDVVGQIAIRFEVARGDHDTIDRITWLVLARLNQSPSTQAE